MDSEWLSRSQGVQICGTFQVAAPAHARSPKQPWHVTAVARLGSSQLLRVDRTFPDSIIIAQLCAHEAFRYSSPQ